MPDFTPGYARGSKVSLAIGFCVSLKRFLETTGTVNGFILRSMFKHNK